MVGKIAASHSLVAITMRQAYSFRMTVRKMAYFSESQQELSIISDDLTSRFLRLVLILGNLLLNLRSETALQISANTDGQDTVGAYLFLDSKACSFAKSSKRVCAFAARPQGQGSQRDLVRAH